MYKVNSNKNKEIKIYTILMALLPIVSIYSSGVPGINLGELLLIVFSGYIILFSNKFILNKRVPIEVLVLGIYVVISTLVAMFIDNSQFIDIFVRMFRFLFYLWVIIYLSRKFLDVTYASKLIKNISVLATIYIIVQNIAYHGFNILIKGFVPFIPVYTSEYATLDYEAMYEMVFYRPTSFFLEPAHYAQYIIIGIVICLWDKNISTKKEMFIAAFLTLGIAISTSGQGLLITVIIWIIYIIFNIIKNIKNANIRLIHIVGGIGLIIACVLLLNMESVQNNIMRITSRGSSTAVAARVEGFVSFLNHDSIFTQLFGLGFGNTPYGVWFSGMAYILNCSGIIGFMIVIYIYIKYIFSSVEISGKMIVITCCLLSISAEIINSYWIVFMFSLFIYSPSRISRGKEVRDEKSSDISWRKAIS